MPADSLQLPVERVFEKLVPRCKSLSDRLSLPAEFFRYLVERIGELQLSPAVGVDIALRSVAPRLSGFFCLSMSRFFVCRYVSRFALLAGFNDVFDRFRYRGLLSENQINHAAAKIPVKIADRCMSRMNRGRLYEELVDDEQHDQKQNNPENWFNQAVHEPSECMMVVVVVVRRFAWPMSELLDDRSGHAL